MLYWTRQYLPREIQHSMLAYVCTLCRWCTRDL